MRFMLFDRWNNPLGDLPYVAKAVRTRATDATDTLDITTIGEINKDERIVLKDSMGRWAEYLCQSTQTARAAGMPVTTAYCAGSITELSRTYIEDKRNRDATAKTCLAKALEGTRWTVGTVQTGTLTATADLSFYHCSVLDAIQKTADTYGLEIQTEYQPDPTGTRITTRTIHLLEHRGSTDTTKRFEYGKDLTQIKRDLDATDVTTRLYGWGKGVEQTNDAGEATGGYGRKLSFRDINHGKPYVQDDTALADWGVVGPDGSKRHSEASVDFPDCEDPAELLRLTRAELRKRVTPIVSYTADVAALGQAGYDAEGVDVGDTVRIVDTSFTTPLRLEGRVLQIEEDLAGGLSDTRITLGNIRQTYTQRISAQQQALDKLVSNSGAWNSAASGGGTYMKDLIDRINQVMNATGGYVYMKPGQGIYVYDKPEDQNPTQCIHIGGGFWRIASSKKANGDWDFRALANGKGIFADTLFTGMLHDAAGLNYWDLDTGEFSLSARTSVGGKTVQDYADQAEKDANGYTDKAKQDAITEAKRQADAADAAKLAEAKKYAETKASDALTAAKAQSKSDSDAAKAAAQAYVDALDESLGQKSVFDRLTNNGQTQGIYLNNGLLYLNATYMKTGVLDAALVKAGRLTDKKGLNYWDLDSGEFQLSAYATTDAAKGYATDAGKASNAYTDKAVADAKTHAGQLQQEAQDWAKAYADSITSYTGGNLVRNPDGDPARNLDGLISDELVSKIPSHPEGITTGIHMTSMIEESFGWKLDTYRGRTYSISFWAYRASGKGSAGLGFYVGGHGFQWPATTSGTSNGWVHVTGRYTIPADATEARFAITKDANGNSSDGSWYLTGLTIIDETAIEAFVKDTDASARADLKAYTDSADANVRSALKAYADSGDTSMLAAAKTFATNQAKSQVDSFEKELTQLYIFNKLTNNGKTQGIYLSNGLLYINATYMKTGIITGKRSYWNLDTGQFVMTDANNSETVHLDGNGANNLLVGTFQTARTGKRVRISPDFNSYAIGGTETYEGSGISFPLDGTYASSPSIWSYSKSSESGDMSGLAFLSGYRTASTPGAFGRFWSHKYLSDKSKIESQAYFTANTEYSKDSTTDSGGSLSLYSRQSYGGEAILNAWSPSGTCIAGVKATGGKARAYAVAADANGEVGMLADISDGYLYLGGYLGGLTGRSTFQAHWWEGETLAAMQYHQFTFTSASPAKYGSYKALATVDHRGDDWALIWSTVSDCTASGWLIWVSAGPDKVITDVASSWNYDGNGVVSNLKINTTSVDLFNGAKTYYLNTIGYLKK